MDITPEEIERLEELSGLDLTGFDFTKAKEYDSCPGCGKAIRIFRSSARVEYEMCTNCSPVKLKLDSKEGLNGD